MPRTKGIGLVWAWRSSLTLLSELGIMASVIQEPKRDPEALTVIGLLTAVRRPQPVSREGLCWVRSQRRVESKELRLSWLAFPSLGCAATQFTSKWNFFLTPGTEMCVSR